MNNHNHLTSADPTAPPPQPQPPRSSFSCDRHPQEQFTGFCPSCLCERLTTLDHSSNSNTPSSSRRPSSASNAIKALFASKPPALQIPKLSNPKPSTSFLPELRRSKSFSASKNEALFGGVGGVGGGGASGFEPQRKSCDVRVRSTLWSLFEQEENKRSNLGEVCDNCDNASFSQDNRPNVVKPIEYSEPIVEETENVVLVCNDEENDDVREEIRPVRETNLGVLAGELEVSKNSREIIEEEVVLGVSDLKAMKHHYMEDDNVVRGKKGSGGGFWSAASVFSKKWQKWRQKQKVKKKRTTDTESLTTTLPVEKPISRQYRETQSEIADYGFGRRSCDTDPRFSLDAARISFDDPRYSFDEPRASWDGYLMGRSFPRMAPPMLSVLEDDGPQTVRAPRSDMHIPVEDTNSNEGIDVPGGSMQTKEYYADSSSRRRKSLDRSSSIRRTAASVVAEIDELKIASNARVSPAAADSYHAAKVVANGGGDFRDLSSHSLRDDNSETFELSNVGRVRETSTASSVVGFAEERKEPKKSKKWSWKLWGFMHRRGKEENDDDKYSSRGNGVVGRSLSESWQDFRNGQANVDGNKNGTFNTTNMLRSNSSVSWRHSNQIGSSFNSGRKSSVELNGYSRNKRREEFGLERNRSARYSPSQVDNNGLLRFYLTPTSGGGRRSTTTGKVKGGGGNNNNNHHHPHSIARSVLRLY